MDVVANEVKKLGGSLRISSVTGQGTNFTVRLPFTLAITQALIVRTGEEVYALPLPSVEGVARIPRGELENLLSQSEPSYQYGEETYRFRHLGMYLGGQAAVLPKDEPFVPVILVRAGEFSAALLTDEMLASREIVVKSVGPQLASIRGITGATILGDGRIVLILDINALVRTGAPVVELKKAAPTPGDVRPIALVVDDSITVRRVTERFLHRHGMRVLTAKDGLDAISVLQDTKPDVILLDIEMPRMDGYEFASHVRNDERYADVPIIMITSRVGDKHRARAIGHTRMHSCSKRSSANLRTEESSSSECRSRRTIQPARTALRRTADRAARLCRGGRALLGAAAGSRRTQLDARDGQLERAGAARRLVRGHTRQGRPCSHRPHPYRGL
jgi:chemosensory pili system protein ChpA (sensor histidine kinase/response regulator)